MRAMLASHVMGVVVPAAVAALAAVPMVADSDTSINLLISIFVYAMLASSWNILGGFTGQTSLGHADLVDEELGGLVGMDVVECRSEAHHRVAVDRDGEVVTRIGEELPRQVRPDRLVEDVCH